GIGAISIRDRDGKELLVFREHGSASLRMGYGFSADDRFFVSTSSDGAVKVWETDTGKVRWSGSALPLPPKVGPAPTGPPPAEITRMPAMPSADGRFLALPTDTGMRVVEFDTLRELFVLDRAVRVNFTPGAHRLLSWHTDRATTAADNPHLAR